MMCKRGVAWLAGTALLLALLTMSGCDSGGSAQTFQDDPTGYALTIAPVAVTLAPGTTQTFTAILTLGGIPVDPQPMVIWSTAPESLGQFSGDIFLAGAPGQSGTITATVDVNGQTLTATAVVTIKEYGAIPPGLVSIEVGPANGEDLSAMPAGCSVQLIAYAVDESGAMTPIADTVQWSVSGGIGTVTQDGVFSATEPGPGKVHATYAGYSGFTRIQVICLGE